MHRTIGLTGYIELTLTLTLVRCLVSPIVRCITKCNRLTTIVEIIAVIVHGVKTVMTIYCIGYSYKSNSMQAIIMALLREKAKRDHHPMEHILHY